MMFKSDMGMAGTRTRLERQQATAAQPDCRSCGNKARLNSVMCGPCEDEFERLDARERELWNCQIIEDLKDFIHTYLLEK